MSGATRTLRIAWLGPVPGGEASARGVATELLRGLADRGHHIDCFFASAGHPLPPELAEHPNLRFVWGTSAWRWNRWYSRTRIGAFATGLLVRGAASMRLRGEIMRRHRRESYDLVYQFSSIETPAVPARLRRSTPLVIHPETHAAGELRWLIAERRLSLRGRPASAGCAFAGVVAIMAARALAQRVAIRRARLVVCISDEFREHLIRDYGVRRADTALIPNPVRLDRFTARAGPLGDPPRVLALGRISARKGVEDVVAVARALLARGVDARVRVIGGPSLWADYTALLGDLPAANSEYVGHMPASEIPAELAHGDVLLQASKYEPFGLTVAEALAAGTPVVATSAVGAIEGVDRSVLIEVSPGDVAGMADAIVEMIARLRSHSEEAHATARAQAQRLFATELVCARLAQALERLATERSSGGHADIRPTCAEESQGLHDHTRWEDRPRVSQSSGEHAFPPHSHRVAVDHCPADGHLSDGGARRLTPVTLSQHLSGCSLERPGEG